MQLVDKLKEITAIIGAKPVLLGFVSQNSALKTKQYIQTFSIDCMYVGSTEQIYCGTASYFASKLVGAKVLIDSTKIKVLRCLKTTTDKELAYEAGISRALNLFSSFIILNHIYLSSTARILFFPAPIV